MVKALPSLMKKSAFDWMADNASRLGAAIAYYTVFSIAPLLVIMMSIAGLVFGHEAVQGKIFEQIAGLVGNDGARTIQSMVASAQKPESSTIATIIGIGVLLLGASGVFGQLKDAINTVWNVKAPQSSGVWGFIRQHIFTFSMVLAVGFLFLVSLLVSTLLAALEAMFTNLIPGPDIVASVLNFIVSFGVISALFALLFKFLPDEEVAWSDVWVGGILTSFLFTVGKSLLGLYLGKTATASSYGAAGSVIIILLWVYYSAQIFLYGAEFTKEYALMRGHLKEPQKQKGAVFKTDTDAHTTVAPQRLPAVPVPLATLNSSQDRSAHPPASKTTGNERVRPYLIEAASVAIAALLVLRHRLSSAKTA